MRQFLNFFSRRLWQHVLLLHLVGVLAYLLWRCRQNSRDLYFKHFSFIPACFSRCIFYDG